MSHYMSRKPLRVAVIGAGPSGLAACRHLAAEPDRFKYVCFEQRPSVGGAWYYAEDNVDYDALTESELETKCDVALNNNSSPSARFQSPMYKNLRVNSPTDLFAFPDFPYRDEHFTHVPSPRDGINEQLRSFVTHEEMLGYLRSYANHYNLMPNMRLNTSVNKVRRIKSDSEDGSLLYRVSTFDTQTDKPRQDEIFDAVMVCIGRYEKRKWPVITNLDEFQGKLMHCKYYRHPKQFPASCKKIAVMGGGYSGVDITIDLDRNSPSKKDIILSVHDLNNVGHLHKWRADCDVKVKNDIVEIVGPNEVKFADGSIEADVDAILIGTGYCYDFPFLSEEDGLALTVDDQCLTPIYKHIIHIIYPTLCFIGTIWTGPTIAQFDQQVRYFLAMLKGDFKLPTAAKMFEWVENDMEYRMRAYKWPKRYAHKMGGNIQREYMASLCEESGITPIDMVLFDIEDEVVAVRASDPVKFKLRNYEWKAKKKVNGVTPNFNGTVNEGV